MDIYTTDELATARGPIASLVSKSEKALQKLAAGSWQHSMLRDNLDALRLASALMNQEPTEAGDAAPGALQGAIRGIAALISKSDQAQAKFPPGTSQHTLLRNRLKALRIAEAMTRAELEKRKNAI